MVYGADQNPQISDSGKIVCGKENEDGGEISRIYYYDGTTVIQLSEVSSDFPSSLPQINNSDQVVWSEMTGEDLEELECCTRVYPVNNIFYYNGATITQLTNNSTNDQKPQINDSGQIVWQSNYRQDDTEIFYYNGTTITQLTNNAYDDQNPQINNSNQIVWVGSDGTDTEIFYYNGTTVTQLTNNAYDDQNPQINDSGQVVWEGSDGTDKEIFYYDGTTVTQLTNNAYDDQNPQINDSNQVVWEGSDGSDTEIFIIKIVNTCTENWQCLEGFGCRGRCCTVEAPPVITAGPFLAAGHWPGLPTSEATALCLTRTIPCCGPSLMIMRHATVFAPIVPDIRKSAIRRGSILRLRLMAQVRSMPMLSCR